VAVRFTQAARRAFDGGGRLRGAVVPSLASPWALGALFNLNHRARYVHWHFFQMSVSNLVVLLLMIAVFVLAIVLPFPGRGERS
jgi:hypothetical protein